MNRQTELTYKKASIGDSGDSSLGLTNGLSRSVFIARFPKDIKTESITEYATKNGITVHNAESMSKEDASVLWSSNLT